MSKKTTLAEAIEAMEAVVDNHLLNRTFAEHQIVLALDFLTQLEDEEAIWNEITQLLFEVPEPYFGCVVFRSSIPNCSHNWRFTQTVKAVRLEAFNTPGEIRDFLKSKLPKPKPTYKEVKAAVTRLVSQEVAQNENERRLFQEQNEEDVKAVKFFFSIAEEKEND